jgi:hypothetical protein
MVPQTRHGTVPMIAPRSGTTGTCAGGDNATALGAADRLGLAAAPTFAMMALQTAPLGGGSADMLCHYAGSVAAERNGPDVPVNERLDERLPFGALAEAGRRPAIRWPPVPMRPSLDRAPAFRVAVRARRSVEAVTDFAAPAFPRLPQPAYLRLSAPMASAASHNRDARDSVGHSASSRFQIIRAITFGAGPGRTMAAARRR